MTLLEVKVSCPVYDSFRVRQVGGMFDVPITGRAEERFCVDVPDWLSGKDWQIGLIVGPSAGGKSTIAKKLFGEQVYEPRNWPTDRAIIDCFGQQPIKEITHLLTAVGLSSPPSWLKPFQVLSGGEQFRCDLARALATEKTLVVFDEFTSVVDRTVAQVVSAAAAKAIRAGHISKRFVAVTCHYDVTAWLTPDWVLDMATGEFSRRSLRRPPIRLEIFRCRHEAWRLFKKHHYLSADLHRSARCYLAVWEERPTAFCAVLNTICRQGVYRISRLVTLPDFQGLGIGTALAEAVGETYLDAGKRFTIAGSHPAILAHCSRSPRWRLVRVKKVGCERLPKTVNNYRGSLGRSVASFEYLGGGFSGSVSQNDGCSCSLRD